MKASFITKMSWCCVILLVAGCMGSKGRIEAPPMDAEAMTNGCMEQLDGDGDGFLTKKEMESAPGLLFAAADLDTDRDDKLSRAEILARFQLYVELNVGFQALSPKVVFPNGRPVEDAEIEMVPEPFMADYIETATGSVIDVDTGLAEISSSDDPEMAGFVRVGMYQVKITSPTKKIQSKYNENTTIGIEVAPVTNAASGEIIWQVR